MSAIDAPPLNTMRAAGRQHCKANGLIIYRNGNLHGLQPLHLGTCPVHTCNQHNLAAHAICPSNKSKTGLEQYFCFKKLVRISRNLHKNRRQRSLSVFWQQKQAVNIFDHATAPAEEPAAPAARRAPRAHGRMLGQREAPTVPLPFPRIPPAAPSFQGCRAPLGAATSRDRAELPAAVGATPGPPRPNRRRPSHPGAKGRDKKQNNI